MHSMATESRADMPDRRTVRVQGPHKLSEPDHRDHLLSQLRDIPPDASRVSIQDDTPSDAEWEMLGAHFTGVHDLELDSGWNEDLNDADMPVHWPLERLLLSSACGEVVRAPSIREGKIRHLVLFLTSGLRFEGPTTAELMQAHKEAVARADEKPRYITVHEGTPKERQVEMVSVPELVMNWMIDKTQKENAEREQQQEQQGETNPLSPEQRINLSKLEIIENDAIDAFIRLTMAQPHLMDSLKTLNLRSTNGYDFNFMAESGFLGILPELSNLQTLVLSVAEIFQDNPTYLSSLVRQFPPNLTTLRFRGPASLAMSDKWDEWVRAVETREILPRLERLSFVLDLNCESGSESGSESDKHKHKSEGKEEVSEEEKANESKKKKEAADERLRAAKTACKQLYAAVEKRGVVVEPFREGWAGKNSIIHPVSERWDEV